MWLWRIVLAMGVLIVCRGGSRRTSDDQEGRERPDAF